MSIFPLDLFCLSYLSQDIDWDNCFNDILFWSPRFRLPGGIIGCADDIFDCATAIACWKKKKKKKQRRIAHNCLLRFSLPLIWSKKKRKKERKEKKKRKGTPTCLTFPINYSTRNRALAFLSFFPFISFDCTIFNRPALPSSRMMKPTKTLRVLLFLSSL